MYSFSCLPAAHDDSPKKWLGKQQSIKHMILEGSYFPWFFIILPFLCALTVCSTVQGAHEYTHTEPILINCFVQNKHKKFSYTFMI